MYTRPGRTGLFQCHRIVRSIFSQKRNFSYFSKFGKSKIKPDSNTPAPTGNTMFQSLRGRDLLTFDGCTRNDIFSLLWIATEIKNQPTLYKIKPRICLIWSNPVTNATVSYASQQFNSSLCSIHEDRLGNDMGNLLMLGRSLGAAADLILIDAPTWSQQNVELFATGCTSPVVLISSEEFSPALAYSEMLTLFEKHGFLRRLIITCISSGNNVMLNTYFALLPTIGVHLRYLTYTGLQNQLIWEGGMKLSTRNNTETKQFENIHDALYRSHCISTCCDALSADGLMIKPKDVKEMDLDWSILQHDSHKGLSVSKDILRNTEHNLIYKSIENQVWIFQALILAHTSDYIPTSHAPRFEGVD